MTKIDHRRTRRGIFRRIAEKIEKETGVEVKPLTVSKRYAADDIDTLRLYNAVLKEMQAEDRERAELKREAGVA